MSSPLEGRIRALAREEAAALLGVGVPDSTAADSVTQLQAEVADLRRRLDAMERASGQTGQEIASAARRTRKTAE